MRYENIICGVCGAVCDDIEVEVEDGKFKVKNACALGKAKFSELAGEERITQPLVGGKEAGWDEALRKAASHLGKAKHPLIFMGCETSTETAKIGLELAERLGGVFDCHPTVCEGPMMMGVQGTGMSSATLGEVKNRADVVVFWGANPMESHLRHLLRYSLFPEGEYMKGRKERTLVVVDPRKTKTAGLADLHIQVEPSKDYELISALKAYLRGHAPMEDVGGVPAEKIKEFAELLKGCSYGAVFVGLGLASSPGKQKNLERLMALVRDLNKHTRFVMIANLGHGNVSGVIQAATSYSGYPFGVDYSQKIPRYNPGEHTTVDLLKRKEVDCMLVVAADLASHLPGSVIEYMKKIPVVSVNISRCPTTLLSDVVLPGVVMGMESAGTIYRMDNVPLELRKFTDPPFKFTESDEDTLKQLNARIRDGC